MKDSWKKFKESKFKEFQTHLKKGRIDEQIIPLIKKINKNPNLVTISSCAGRITLISEGEKEKFHRKWHRKVKPEEIELAIIDYTKDKLLWFRYEPFVLTVGAKNEKTALEFLRRMRIERVRGGIESISKDRIIVEIQGTGNISIPINYVEGSWNKIILLANKMLEENFKKIRLLEKTLK